MKNLKQLIENARRRGLDPILHHRPLTRRDLIAQGIIGGYGMMATPSVLSYAQAQDAGCAAGSAGNGYQDHMIYAQFELAGGSSITKYFHPKGQNGVDIVANGLNQLAVTRVDPVANPENVVNTADFGIPLWQGHAFFLGLWAGTLPAVRANMSGFGIASTSNDDNAGNMHTATEILIRNGVSGSLLKAMGTNETKNGARSQTPASWIGSDSATVINSPNDARGLMEAVALSNQLPGRGAAIVSAAKTMSESRLAAFSAKSLPEQIRELIKCNYVQAEAVAATSLANTVDINAVAANGQPNLPQQDILASLALSLVNGGTNPTPPGRTDNGTATPNPLAYTAQALNQGDTLSMLSQLWLALTGNGNILNVVLGGYDYHQQDVSQNNQKDFNVGLLAGRYFSAVHFYNELMGIQRAAGLVIVTDGAAGGLGAANGGNATTADGDRTAGGDRGEGSGALVLQYTPGGRVALVNSGITQINYYTDGGGVGRDGIHAAVADSPEAKIQAAIMNLMHVDGRIDVATAFPEPFTNQADWLLFNKWR